MFVSEKEKDSYEIIHIVFIFHSFFLVDKLFCKLAF